MDPAFEHTSVVTISLFFSPADLYVGIYVQEIMGTQWRQYSISYPTISSVKGSGETRLSGTASWGEMRPELSFEGGMV